jgi:hypothetical protein
VPSYDLRTYTQTVRALNDQLNETTTKLAPRTRFQFKRGTAAAGAAKKPDSRVLAGPAGNAAAEVSEVPAPAATKEPVRQVKDYNDELAKTDAPSDGVRRPSFSAARDVLLGGHSRLHIVLPATAVRTTSSGALTDLQECVVDMSAATSPDGGGGFASLALKNISGSVVVAGRVSGSAHITGVRNSAIVVVARQVRIHECENVDLYLHCASHPIIEDCKGMRFAPPPACYVSRREVTASHADMRFSNQMSRSQGTTTRRRTSGTRWTTSNGSRQNIRPTGVFCPRKKGCWARAAKTRYRVVRRLAWMTFSEY